MSKYVDIKNFRSRLKERMIYVMGDCCSCCGYNKSKTALEFHHLDPNEKSFTLSKNANRNWTSVCQELKKCIMVCANCHREIHEGLIDNSTLKSSFSEVRAQEIETAIETIKQKTIYICEDCGTVVSKGHSLCSECANKRKRLVARPSREELKILIRTKPFTKIAQDFKVSDNAIRKWCKAVNLPFRAKDIKMYSDEEWEII